MATFPADNAFLENGITQGERRARHTAHLLATKQLWGAAGEESLTIASGVVTPTRGTIVVDTEAAASTDTLTHITTSNIPDGGLVALRIADNGRVVTLAHGATGIGEILLSAGLDFQMNRTEQSILLQRRGNVWQEISRFGREKEHIVGAAGEPQFENGWSVAFSLSFWKDNDGVVRLRGGATRTGPVTSNLVIFTLPVGYRPSANLNPAFPVRIVDDTGTNTAYLTIGSDGGCRFQTVGNIPSQSDVIVEASPVSFRAEQ